MALDGKRGQWLQLFVAVPILFIFILVAVFMNKVGSELNTELQGLDEAEFSNQSKNVMANTTNAQPNIFDGLGALVMVGLWLAAMVAAYAVDSHPLWGVIGLFLIIGLSVAGMILANTWDDLEADGQLTSYAADFPIMNFIFGHYLIVVLVMSFSTLWVLLYRGSGGGYG